MRIALLAPFGVRPKGTVHARILPLAHALAARGHMVRVVIPPWDDPSARKGGKRLQSVHISSTGKGEQVAGVHTVTLPLPRWLPKSLSLTAGLLREALRPTNPGGQDQAERSLIGFRAEVAHVFKPVGYTGLAGFALSGLRIPWVLDVDDWEGPGGWADLNRYSRAERLSILIMEALLPRMAGAVTAASKTLEARAWNMGIPRPRVIYLPNGVWRDKYASWQAYSTPNNNVQTKLRAALGLGSEPTVLLYTRFDVFPLEWPLLIMRKVLSEHPTAKLLVIGQGFAGEESTLRAEAGRMGIAANLVMTGYVSGDKLPAHLSLADACIYPMRDTLLNRAKSPMKLLEPMLMGLPIVAHRVGEAAQFVGDAGVLVPPGNLAGIASALSALLSDPSKRAQLGKQANRRAWSHFNWESLSAKAEDAYDVALRMPNKIPV
jgi:glycosyltransferase involved in cell wall biosynthesis